MIGTWLVDGPVETASKTAAGVDFGTLIIGGAVIAVVVLVVVFIALRFWPERIREDARTQAAKSTQLEAEITKLYGAQEVLLKQLRYSDERREEEAQKRQEVELKRVEAERKADAKVAQLEEQIRVLRQQLEDKKVIARIPQQRKLTVLGIWPGGEGLDPKANAQALAEAGVDYTELSGPRASMEYIFYQIPRKPYTAIEVGGRGDADGIMLADGKATTSWWAELANEYNIEYFMLLADDTGGTNKRSLADAIFSSSNVRAVLSVEGEVPDEVARKFARAFYARVAEGKSLAVAVRQARMPVGPEYGKLFTLREKDNANPA